MENDQNQRSNAKVFQANELIENKIAYKFNINTFNDEIQFEKDHSDLQMLPSF